MPHHFSIAALHWMLSPEPQESHLPAPLIEDVLMSEAYVSGGGQTYLRKALLSSDAVIAEVEERTRGQRNNATWAAIRKLRVTASNFGVVLKAIRLNRYLFCPLTWLNK